MTLAAVDIVLLMSKTVRMRAVACSGLASERMVAEGSASHFQLGEPFPGRGGGCCEPHVSLFMLAVDEVEVNEVVNVVARIAKTLPSLDAEGVGYDCNPYGALEVYFAKSEAWHALQRAVIMSVEPLRRGRMREVDPSGARIRDLVDHAPPDDSRRQQLVRYGYDEVADQDYDGHDRFNPHVTLAWPHDPDHHVVLDGLPDPGQFSGLLTELAVFGMGPYGTCIKNYGVFSLGAAPSAGPFMESRAPQPAGGSASSERGFECELLDFS